MPLLVASERVLVLVRQCNPNPEVAKLVQNINTAPGCNVIAKFKLN
ncbi:Membrane protein (fragment) [Vibrio tapetis subsp. tapetis]|uniref:Membrane protein n=1 Tax=Vibrio tapetis subsp. tapetis TaxID=1671868 RepID=A0A2N8ZNG4_9VIBR